jgi:hypothetical protein
MGSSGTFSKLIMKFGDVLKVFQVCDACLKNFKNVPGLSFENVPFQKVFSTSLNFPSKFSERPDLH